jgi:polyhydroxyalkanoate synthase subunit PhaC
MDPFECSRQAADHVIRTPRKLRQAPYRALQLAAAEPGETPYDVVCEESPIRPRRYEPPDGEVDGVPIVIAYAFISDPSILDLTPERSVVRAFPVYVVDWGDPSPLEFRSSERQTSAGFAGRG